MNREGLTLLRCVIERIEGLQEDVKKGDCKVIAVALNGFMPADMQITPVDVFHALKDSPNFGHPSRNAEVLRARIDRVGVLYSARLNSAYQTIVNELNMSPEPDEQVTTADVMAAMALRVVPQPERVAQGAATLIGIARVG